jgi:GR25 family glycosyltransferase involved in LPS biosynthesis
MIIKYNDLILENNNNKYKILIENNNNNLIITNNNNISIQIQFKLKIKGFNNFSLENKTNMNNYNIEEDIIYFISFILEINQEIKINFYNNNLDKEKYIIIEELSENIINTNQQINFDKVYIINLERRNDRKNKISNELKKVGITNYEFITAIDGKNPDIYKMYKKLKNEKKSKLKSSGHLGCLLSHVKVLNKAYTDGCNQSLIIEDDIFFKYNNFIDELKNIIICPWKIIFLGAPIIEKKIFLNKWAHCNKFPGTYGYIIKRELIQNTLTLINTMENSIDLIFMKYLHKSNFCFILNDFVLTDIVDSDTSKKKPIFQKLIDNLNKDLI